MPHHCVTASMDDIWPDILRGMLLWLCGATLMVVFGILAIYAGITRLVHADAADIWDSMSMSAVVYWSMGKATMCLFVGAGFIMPFCHSVSSLSYFAAGSLLVVCVGLWSACEYTKAQLVSQTSVVLSGKRRVHHEKYLSEITQHHMRLRAIAALFWRT